MFPSVNFGLLGPIVSDRFFEITGPYTGCQTDIGWLVVTSHPVCPWDRRSPQPSIQYSKQGVASRMENYGNFDIEIFLTLYSVDRVPITNKKNLLFRYYFTSCYSRHQISSPEQFFSS